MKKSRNIAIVLVALIGIVPTSMHGLNVPLDKDVKCYQSDGAFLQFSMKQGPLVHSSQTPLVVVPSCIGGVASKESKEWKQLFAWGRHHGSGIKAVEVAEGLVQSQIKKPETEFIFLKKAMVELAPFVTKAELDYVYSPTGLMKLKRVVPCGSCFGRYHLQNVGSPDAFASLSVIKGSDDCYCNINMSRIVPNDLDMRKILGRKTGSAQFTTDELRGAICTMCHEMVHIARLDGSVGFYNQNNGWIRHAIEFQADSIAQLILQHESYFLAFAERLIAMLFFKTYELDLLQSAYDPKDVGKLKKAFTSYKSQFDPKVQQTVEFLRHLPEESQIAYMKNIAQKFYWFACGGHPYVYMRLRKILTMWTAYLVHERSWAYNQAIEEIQRVLIGRVDLLEAPVQYHDRIDIIQNVIIDWAQQAKRESFLASSKSHCSSSSASSSSSQITSSSSSFASSKLNSLPRSSGKKRKSIAT
jgi:hypothetical protein